jgi:hypothetical protein
MGVISDLRINRGGDDNTAWTIDGNVNEIDATFSITPLISKLMISRTGGTDGPFNFIHNAGLQDYLGTLCGVDMHMSQTTMKIDTLLSLVGNTFTDIPMNLYRGFFDNTIINSIRDMMYLP